MSGSYGTHCEHSYEEVDFSLVVRGRSVEPWVNVTAAPGTGPSMTYGMRYRCSRCRRVVDLTRPRGFPAPTQARILRMDWDFDDDLGLNIGRKP